MKGCLFEVGDKVWSVVYGWGEVEEIKESRWPVRVLHNNGDLIGYTYDGREFKEENRTLFFEEIPIPQSALIKTRK